MHFRTFQLSAIVAFALLLAPAAAQDGVRADHVQLIKRYLEALAAINQQVVSKEAEKEFNALFTPDIVYEIPGRKMRFQGEEFLNSENGSGRTRNTSFALEAFLAGDGVAFARVRQSAEIKDRDGQWKPLSATELLVFEFEGAKIKRIIDY